MIRRSSAVLAAIVALMTLSSCATFNRNDIAAGVGSHSLTAAAAQGLVTADPTSTPGDQLRQQITTWVRITVLSNEAGTIVDSNPTAASLQAQAKQAVDKLGPTFAREAYESGAEKSPKVCLGAIPVATADDAKPVLDALATGTSFADAAKKYSTDSTLASSGGVVTDQSGAECFSVNPAIVTALAKVPVGQPVVVDLTAPAAAVVVMRPFDSLSDAAKAVLASAGPSQEQFKALVAKSRVYVDPRYGRWDPATGSVVPLTS